jgi:methylated-DNA-[protein]-cysteine S-methyltransferase
VNPSLSPDFLERLATAAIDEGLPDAVYTSFETPIGRLVVAQTARGVCKVGLANQPEDYVLAQVAQACGARLVASQDATAEARDALSAYLEGDTEELPLPVDFALVRSPFQHRVLDALRSVERGHTTTYAGLAGAIGSPRAMRATGTALGRNPIPVIVPCHRVVPASGGVGGYGGGPEVKRQLLRLEGALPPASGVLPRTPARG